MSYETMSGLGQFEIHSGAAGLGATACGPATGTLGPTGGTRTGPDTLLCGGTLDSDPIAQLCNKTYDPLQCYSIKKNGVAYVGRAPGANWATWNPIAGSAAPSGAAPSGGSGDDNTMLYVGLGVAALAVVGVVVVVKRRGKK